MFICTNIRLSQYPIIASQIYQYVAEWLTGLELHRTQTEHDDALSLKIYLLQGGPTGFNTGN